MGSSEVDNEVEGWDEEWESINREFVYKERERKGEANGRITGGQYWGKSRENILLHGKFVEK